MIAVSRRRELVAYAQATLAMTGRLSLTAGVRHTRDEKEFANDQYLITGTVSPSSLAYQRAIDPTRAA